MVAESRHKMSVSFGHLLLQYKDESESAPLCQGYTSASSCFCAVQGMNERSIVAIKQAPFATWSDEVSFICKCNGPGCVSKSEIAAQVLDAQFR